MKWVLVAAGAIIGLVALVALIGSLLPKNHVASRTARLQQPPEAVWQVITDFAAQPSWQSDLRGVERLPDQNGHPVWKEIRKGGPLILENVEFTPPRRMVRRIADPSLPFGGNWTYQIEPSAGGCTLTITENGEVYNPIFRFVSRFLMDQASTIEAYLKALGKKLGQEVSFEKS